MLQVGSTPLANLCENNFNFSVSALMEGNCDINLDDRVRFN